MRTGFGTAVLWLAVIIADVGLGTLGLASHALAQGAAKKSQSPQSAPADTPAQEPPMQVKVVRLAEPGCDPDCPEWISAIGRIDATTPGEFRKVLTKLGNRKLPILIDSGGGTVEAGYSVGRMIRIKGLDVVVTRTEFTACTLAVPECTRLKARGIALGRPVAKISKCASSCAFVLAGGVRRYVGPWTFVGLHELKSISYLVQRQYLVERRIQYGVPVEVRRTLVKEQTTAKKEGPTAEKVYDKVKSYFVEMGISEDVMPLLRSAPHTSIRLLKVSELQAIGLATDFLNGEQLLMPAKEAIPSVLPPITSAGGPVAPGNGLSGIGVADCSRSPGIVMPCVAGSVPSAPSPTAWSAAPPKPIEAPPVVEAEPAAAPPSHAPVVAVAAPAPALALAPAVPLLVAPALPQPLPTGPAAARAPEAAAVVEARAEPATPAEAPQVTPPATAAVVAKPKPKPAAKPRPQQAERFDPFRSN